MALLLSDIVVIARVFKTRYFAALRAHRGADLLRLSPAELDNHVSGKTLHEIFRALEDESVKLDP